MGSGRRAIGSRRPTFISRLEGLFTKKTRTGARNRLLCELDRTLTPSWDSCPCQTPSRPLVGRGQAWGQTFPSYNKALCPLKLLVSADTLCLCLN